MATPGPLSDNLQPLRRALFALIERAQESVQHGLAALLTGDRDRADAAHEHEKVSDGQELIVADHALLALVRLQPLASDLRFVLVARDVAHQLERAADQGARLAKYGRQINDEWRQFCAPLLDDLCEATRKQFIAAADYLRRMDSQFLEHAVDADASIDALHDQLKARLVERLATGLGQAGTEQALWCIDAARRLERLGDIAVGLARQTVFGATGEVAHTHAEVSTSERLYRLTEKLR